MKAISTLSLDDPSANSASASRRSPLRVPRICPRVNKERFSRPLRSSTGGFGGLVHDARRTMTQQSDWCPNAVFGIITLCSRADDYTERVPSSFDRTGETTPLYGAVAQPAEG